MGIKVHKECVIGERGETGGIIGKPVEPPRKENIDDAMQCFCSRIDHAQRRAEAALCPARDLRSTPEVARMLSQLLTTASRGEVRGAISDSCM